MGNSLTGKELGMGIVQSKDGRFLGRFVNRFGKTESIRVNNHTELRKALSEAKYKDYGKKNLTNPNMTLAIILFLILKQYNCLKFLFVLIIKLLNVTIISRNNISNAS